MIFAGETKTLFYIFSAFIRRLKGELDSQLNASSRTRSGQSSETAAGTTAGRRAGRAGRVYRVEIIAIESIKYITLKTQIFVFADSESFTNRKIVDKKVRSPDDADAAVAQTSGRHAGKRRRINPLPTFSDV